MKVHLNEKVEIDVGVPQSEQLLWTPELGLQRHQMAMELVLIFYSHGLYGEAHNYDLRQAWDARYGTIFRDGRDSSMTTKNLCSAIRQVLAERTKGLAHREPRPQR